MKTIKGIAVLFAATVILTACGKSGPEAMDSVIEQYEQACQEGDPVKAKEIAKGFSEADLTPEQSVRIIKASNAGAKAASDAFKEVSNTMPYNVWDIELDKYEDLIHQYEAVLKQKQAGKKVKDKLNKLDDKIDAQEDKLDDAKLTKAQKARFKKLEKHYEDIED